jgi:hypothetical protein
MRLKIENMKNTCMISCPAVDFVFNRDIEDRADCRPSFLPFGLRHDKAGKPEDVSDGAAKGLQ